MQINPVLDLVLTSIFGGLFLATLVGFGVFFYRRASAHCEEGKNRVAFRKFFKFDSEKLDGKDGAVHRTRAKDNVKALAVKVGQAAIVQEQIVLGLLRGDLEEANRTVTQTKKIWAEALALLRFFSPLDAVIPHWSSTTPYKEWAKRRGGKIDSYQPQLQ